MCARESANDVNAAIRLRQRGSQLSRAITIVYLYIRPAYFFEMIFWNKFAHGAALDGRQFFKI